MSNAEDPFEVLGVSRDSDDRELKKRYFALMREFPPETHPVEFARIQAAWEIVSDPERRAAHVAQAEPFDDLAEPWRSRMREALRLLQTDHVDLGRVQLKTLIEENPELDDARELLQQVLYNHEQWAEAEVELRVLVTRQPDNARFLSRLVLVLGRLDRHVDALAVANQWLEVSKRKDPMAWVYVAETLGAQKRYPEALSTIDEGLKAVDAKVPLVLTRLQLRLEMTEKPAVAMAALAADVALLERVIERDDETRKAVGQRLQSMAALFFNRNRADEANALISASRRVWSQSQAVQFPPSVEVFIDDLPPTSRQWLADESKEQHIFRVLRRGKATDLVIALGLTASAAYGVADAVTVSTRWNTDAFVLETVVLAALVWLSVWAWRQVALSFTTEHRRMVSVHGLYLLEVGLEKLRAWPLVNFSDVRVVHHHTNGVYTNSVATLTFGKKKVNLSIRGQSVAVKFAETLQGFRYRALQLLHGGMLEAEEGYDFIPHAFLAPQFVSPLRSVKRRALAMRTVTSVVAVAVVAAGSFALGIRADHERQLRDLLNGQKRDQAALLYVTTTDADDRRLLHTAFEQQLKQRGPQLVANVSNDSVRSSRVALVIAALQQTDVGGLKVAATISGENLGSAEAFSREVEKGISGQLSWLASAVVVPGSWDHMTAVVVSVAVRASRGAGVGIGPDASQPLIALKATVTVAMPNEPLRRTSFELETALSEGEVLGLAGKDVAGIQAKALAKKLGALLADELGLGRTAVAVTR